MESFNVESGEQQELSSTPMSTRSRFTARRVIPTLLAGVAGTALVSTYTQKNSKYSNMAAEKIRLAAAGWTGTMTEWPDCMTIPTFPGKCPVEEHPGACYRTDGKMWSCWADWEELDDDDCQSMTLNDEIVGFEGACKYELYGKKMKASDVADCFDVDRCLAECHPITDKWGACYVEDDTGVDRAERCMCALKADAPGGDSAFLETLLKYGCKTKQIGYMDKAYEELCLFPDDGPQPIYKCDTVPTYNARNSAVACNPAVGNDFACFSLTRRTPWQCGMAIAINPSCRTTTLTPAGPPFYDGACLYKGAPGYGDAIEYEEP
jgi:hypothetical protein